MWVFFQFRDLVETFVADNHPLALEKGLGAAFANNNCDVAGTAARVGLGVIGYSLTTPKGQIREAAQQVRSFLIVVVVAASNARLTNYLCF